MGHRWLISRKVLEASRRELIFMANRHIGRRLEQISPEKVVEKPWKFRKTKSTESTSASRLLSRHLAIALFQAKSRYASISKEVNPRYATDF